MPDLTITPEIERAMELLESGSHLFLTGKAGTGKSTLIRHFLATTERRVVVAAPTGIAALNVDGYTIHRLFGFRPTTTLADVRSGTYRPGRFTRAIRGLQTLVIDEASMVRADVFDHVGRGAVVVRLGLLGDGDVADVAHAVVVVPEITPVPESIESPTGRFDAK